MQWDVTIGIPVYNGEDRLDITLASLVKDHLGVKEIFISDNASTDRTPEIAQKYADKYDNIHYIRQPKKIPVGDNWLATLKPATGKYFIFISHHDLISANYFSELVPLLEEDDEAVVAMPSVRAFRNEIGDLPTVKEQLPFYIDPFNHKLLSPNIRDRIYAVLKDPSPAALSINQIMPTHVVRKIWGEFNNKWNTNSDVIVAMYLATLGTWKASYKAFYYYWNRPAESEAQTKERYSDNIQGDVSMINLYKHIINMEWYICQRYAPQFCDDLLRTDMLVANLWKLNANFDDQAWVERRITTSPPSVTIPNVSRAYCAISTAIREEENCRFYRNHYKGQFSEFRPIAEQRALQFYLRMWEILLNEGYIAPQYKLNAEETQMLNKLMSYKNERLQYEQRMQQNANQGG